MRCLEINKKSLSYCLYTGMTDVTIDNIKTGEKKITYSLAKTYNANISTVKGDSQFEFFGNFNDYDKVIVADDPSWDITENSVLFIDKQVAYDTDNTPLFDYEVTKVARSLNSIAVAIKRVA